MRRINKATEKFDYIGSSICHNTQEDAINYAESVNHYGDDYYYVIEPADDKYLVRFYSFNYKKAYLELKREIVRINTL